MPNLAAQECVEHKKIPDRRRQNKQQMERRRRARINECLDRIKAYVLGAMKKDPSEYDKLEKADILELAVRYLKGRNERKEPLIEGSYRPRDSPMTEVVLSKPQNDLFVAPDRDICSREHQSFIDLNNQLQSQSRMMENTDQKTSSPVPDHWTMKSESMESQKAIWRPW